MTALRTVLSRVLLPLLAVLLAPDLVRLVQAVAGDRVFDWARQLDWWKRVGFGLVATSAIAIFVLRRIEADSDLLAARRFLPFWTDCWKDSACSGTIRFAGRTWLITARPAVPGARAEVEFQLEPDLPTSHRLRHRAHRLCELARTLTARGQDATAASRPG
jgi:hypothetical protein